MNISKAGIVHKSRLKVSHKFHEVLKFYITHIENYIRFSIKKEAIKAA